MNQLAASRSEGSREGTQRVGKARANQKFSASKGGKEGFGRIKYQRNLLGKNFGQDLKLRTAIFFSLFEMF